MTTQDLGNVILSWGVRESRPAWPTVIGIIAVVLGGLGVVGGLWGTIGPLLAGLLSPQVAPTERPTFEVTQQWRAWTIPLSLLSSMVAAGLVLAGITLLRRRAQARQMCLIWAAAKLALVIASTAIYYRIARQIVELTAEQAAHAPRIASVAGRQFAELEATVGLSFGVAWGVALPIFLLIWFTRDHTREEVARWKW